MFAPAQKRDAVALFAANMRRIRKAKKLTQEQVAEGADLHPNYISSVERAERNVSIRNIERIAAALDVSMAELLENHDWPEFAERLKNALREAGYEARPSVLEKEFNARHGSHPVTFQGASRWLKGLSIPDQDTLELLAGWLNVEARLLRFGEAAGQKGGHWQPWDAGIGSLEREAIDAFLKFPAAQRKVIRDVVLMYLRACSGSTGDPV
jgi:transcriptional regulator with XRE-family HTH domain